MIFAPPRTRASTLLSLAALLAALLGIALIVRGVGLPPNFGEFLAYTLGALLIAAALPLGYWARAVATLHYEVTGGALLIHWGAMRQVVPLRAVQRVVLGRHLPLPEVHGLHLPGAAVGRGNVSRIGSATLYQRSHAAAELLYVITAEGAYGLSLADPQPFVRALQHGQQEQGSDAAHSGVRWGLLGRFALLGDRRARAMSGVALLAAWLAAGVVYLRFQHLAGAITLHFPATESAHLAPRGDLLQIPASAFIWLAISAGLAVMLYRRARVASYLLLGSAALAGAVYLVAAVAATG